MNKFNNEALTVIGKNIKALRKRYYPRDDQRSFATRINVSRATFQKMEKGDLSISMSSYFAAAKLFGVAEQFNALFTAPIEKVDLLEALDLWNYPTL